MCFFFVQGHRKNLIKADRVSEGARWPVRGFELWLSRLTRPKVARHESIRKKKKRAKHNKKKSNRILVLLQQPGLQDIDNGAATVYS